MLDRLRPTHLFRLAAFPMALAIALVTAGATLAQDPATQTVHMSFELQGDAAEQHYHDVGADGSVRYGTGRVIGQTELQGLPVDVASEFWIRYEDGTGPFTGSLTISDADGSELGLAYEGFTVQDASGSSRIIAAMAVIGGSGVFADVTGIGRMDAHRDGPVGTPTYYELTLELSGLPEPASTSVLTDPAAAGLDLFSAYADMLVAKDVEGLRELLDPAFLIVRGNGSFAGRDEYLANLPDLRSFALSDVQEVRSDTGIGLRMTAAADLTVDGEPFRTEPAPMLASFRWEDGGWHLVAQGNFNLPS